ncbi:stage IV sporulation protein B [Anaerohalosphaera lusitana]|uniref:Stage IV sporulation protein B n=1 Tax=Anaerohalosphaera lusitana TaxID=1936003 RepID=A0A1U9NH93_9BACT|nr:SpoIVB peptidase S55 domain-containing protein [Anaerohalosphaera lusitana]AQT67175.1 stage IV sporulation protein B [Anaerohalosphaera lusitana]
MKKRNLKNHIIITLFIAVVCAVMTAPALALDSSKYITVDEISTDMDAYCLTVLRGTEVEKFPVEIISVIKNHNPGQDRILVKGTDPQFIHDGSVHGCSGSPVYIDGRMAGALSAGWDICKDPLYLVTPIAEMLEVGEYEPTAADHFPDAPWINSVDLSQPIDLDAIGKTITESMINRAQAAADSGMLSPMITSLPARVCDKLTPQFNALGLRPMRTPISLSTAMQTAQVEQVDFAPGSVLVIPLVSGDIDLSATGTVTEVVGNKVYGFGHQMDGAGPVDMPMANGYVHTVVASDVGGSFKLATAGNVKGAIRADESNAVYGEIDATAKTIPLNITIDRFNDDQIRTYNCQVVSNRSYTPLMVQAAVAGAATMRGPLPQENFITYSANIDAQGFDPIEFANTSSGTGLYSALNEASSSVAMLMANQFDPVEIDSIDVKLTIKPRNIRAAIEQVSVSDESVKPGQTVTITAVTKPYLAPYKTHSLELTIPENTRPGTYQVTVAGSNEYLKLIRKLQPHKFIASDVTSLVSALRNSLEIKRNKIYAVMPLRPGGIVIENNELPFLPATKASLLADPKRTAQVRPQNHWIETEAPIDNIIANKAQLKITVEKP